MPRGVAGDVDDLHAPMPIYSYRPRRFGEAFNLPLTTAVL